jgi:4,5-DOPA dioxygenase extradiol
MLTLQKTPVLFIGHGSPMNAIEDNEFRRGWQNLAASLPKPKAILCISAHWETDGVFVTASEQPETIHDFYGFPQALFDVRYNAPGSPELAKRITRLVKYAEVKHDNNWGLDHGAWSVLLPMYPDADIPVVQLSLDRTQPHSFHYKLAKELAPLRDEGVMIIASGDIVHNLRMFSFRDSNPYDWAVRFNEKIKELILTGKHEEIIDYKAIGHDAVLSVPTPEHYLPLLYTIALQEQGEQISFFNDKAISSISMTSVMIGK